MKTMDDSLPKSIHFPIFLIGFMGCGKSSLGKKLAANLKTKFIDLDQSIEQEQGKKISAIFSDEGETAFRELEKISLHNVLLNELSIVATGGGAPCFFDNIDWMNNHGITIFLDPPIHILVSRLKNAKTERPLLESKTDDELLIFIKEKLDYRRDFYNQAKIILQSSDIKPLDIIQAIKNLDGKK